MDHQNPKTVESAARKAPSCQNTQKEAQEKEKAEER